MSNILTQSLLVKRKQEPEELEIPEIPNDDFSETIIETNTEIINQINENKILENKSIETELDAIVNQQGNSIFFENNPELIILNERVKRSNVYATMFCEDFNTKLIQFVYGNSNNPNPNNYANPELKINNQIYILNSKYFNNPEKFNRRSRSIVETITPTEQCRKTNGIWFGSYERDQIIEKKELFNTNENSITISVKIKKSNEEEIQQSLIFTKSNNSEWWYDSNLNTFTLTKTKRNTMQIKSVKKYKWIASLKQLNDCCNSNFKNTCYLCSLPIFVFAGFQGNKFNVSTFGECEHIVNIAMASSNNLLLTQFSGGASEIYGPAHLHCNRIKSNYDLFFTVYSKSLCDTPNNSDSIEHNPATRNIKKLIQSLYLSKQHASEPQINLVSNIERVLSPYNDRTIVTNEEQNQIDSITQKLSSICKLQPLFGITVKYLNVFLFVNYLISAGIYVPLDSNIEYSPKLYPENATFTTINTVNYKTPIKQNVNKGAKRRSMTLLEQNKLRPPGAPVKKPRTNENNSDNDNDNNSNSNSNSDSNIFNFIPKKLFAGKKNTRRLFKPAKNSIRAADLHFSWFVTDNDLNPSTKGANLNSYRFKHKTRRHSRRRRRQS